MKLLRFAVFGTGFWCRFQLAGWQEIGGVECVALYDRTEQKARDLAATAGLNANVYQDPGELLERERLDFVDIVTNPETHGELVALAAARGLPVICQKPMAPSYWEAVDMVQTCRLAGVPNSDPITLCERQQQLAPLLNGRPPPVIVGQIPPMR